MPTLTHTNNFFLMYVPYEKQQYTNKERKKHYATTYSYNEIL